MLKPLTAWIAIGFLTTLQTCQPDSNSTSNSAVSASSAQFESFSTKLLAAHNQYRTAVNVPPLSWSDALASDAQQWADRLAADGGQLIHAEVAGQGENLWAGTANAYSLQDMVEAWGEEKAYFVSGPFPQVSSTDSWSDVGHYTQMIWRDTNQVGCAIATGSGTDVLVCRYSPPGNIIGQSVY